MRNQMSEVKTFYSMRNESVERIVRVIVVSPIRLTKLWNHQNGEMI